MGRIFLDKIKYMSTAPISLIVGVKDHIEILNLLKSIDENIEVIIVLNNAMSEIKKILEKFKINSFQLKIIEISTSNLGAIKNAGIKNAKNNNLFFLDADCVLAKGALKKISESFKKYDVGKVNMVVEARGLFSRIFANNRKSTKSNAAYTPGLFFKKNIKNRIGGFYYHNDLPWREDYELDQRMGKSNVHIQYLPGIIIYHSKYKLLSDIKTAFRCGGGHQVGCRRGYIKPTWKWGGGKRFLDSIIFDTFRLFYLTTYLFYKDWERFDFFTAVYKFFWKIIFMLGYYAQIVFNFLNT